MANEVAICNLALSRIGKNSIASLNTPTEEGRKCNLHYPFARDSTLRDFDWSFARKTQALALKSETYPGWAFVYAYPADCLAARLIFNPLSDDPADKIPYDLGLSADGTSQVILTDKCQAVLVYTSAVTNSALFESLFSDALVWRLAAELAQPLRNDASLATAMRAQYSTAVLVARARSANEQKSDKPSERSDFLDAR